MVTANELLYGVSAVDKTLIISNDLRTIAIPSSVKNLGVESDDDVLRLNFKMPRYIGNIDLSVFSIRINCLNAEGEGDIYTVSDAVSGSEYITFSWLVGPNATKYKGDTKFNICMRTFASDGTVDREYNTTIASLPVLEGLEVDAGYLETYTDLLEQWRRELFGIGDTEEAAIRAVSEAEQEAIANKGAEVLATIPEDYTTAVSMTDNADRTKADAIICSAQGETISVSDSSDDYLRGLKIFGKTTQTTTTGKNLLPTKNGAYGLRNGLMFTDLGDGRIHIEGTATANTTFVYCPFDVNTRTPIPAGTYTVSGSPGAGVYLSFFVYETQETTDILLNNGSICRGASWTFTLENDAYYGAYLYIGSGKVVKETISAQLELGSVATEYEPYSGGMISPSPEWSQDLHSVENPTIDVYGRNILDWDSVFTSLKVSSTEATLSVNDGTISLSGTPTANFVQANDFLTAVPASWCGKKMYLRATLSGTEPYMIMYIRDASNKSLTAATLAQTGVCEFTMPINAANMVFAFCLNKKTIDGACTATYSDLYLGVEDGEYEPHKMAQSTTLNYSLSAIPVKSGGNYTDADGQEWICDEIDFERGVHIQRVGSIVFDGSADEYWFAQSTRYYTAVNGKRSNRTEVTNALRCSHFKTKYALTDSLGYVSETYYHAGNVNVLFNFDNGVGGVDNFVTWLQANPVTLQYALANPIETPLTAEEIAVFRFTHTNFHNTTVLNDAGATTKLTYNADTKTWLENLPKATDEQVQAAVDAWLTAHYTSAEGASF